MKSKKPRIGTMTMAAGKGIPGSPIRWILKENLKNYQVTVFDGDLDSESRGFYNSLKNVEVVDFPWDDDYVARYRKFADLLPNDSFGLWLDDDEPISSDLDNFLSNYDFEKSEHNIFYLPCILHLTEDGEKYYPVEDFPPNEMSPNTWTKHILFKKTQGLSFWHNGSHVIPRHKFENPKYVPYPYYHFKSLQSFVRNDVLQAFLSPSGQGYNLIEKHQFELFTRDFSSTREFDEAAKEGKWPAPLQMFAYKHINEADRPISRLGWYYWVLLGNKWPYSTNPPKWEDVKVHILGKNSRDMFEKNVKEKNYICIKE